MFLTMFGYVSDFLDSLISDDCSCSCVAYFKWSGADITFLFFGLKLKRFTCNREKESAFFGGGQKLSSLLLVYLEELVFRVLRVFPFVF